MKSKINYLIVVFLWILLAATYCNWKYEIIAIHPFFDKGQYKLKVITWNIHCPNGADSIRQIKIAELIIKENADFVFLNEYNQDRCSIMDSLLKAKYPFTEEYRSHKTCGDIFYSKCMMSNSGRIYIPIKRRPFRTIKATIVLGSDSIHLFGVHMASNHYEGGSIEKDLQNCFSSYERYKKAQLLRNFQAHWTKEVALESKHPVIVMGDMNDFNCSAPLDTFTNNGLRDSWWEGGFGYGHTFHDGWMRLRIDHILHSDKLKLKSIKVIETNLSDHNPVVAKFSL